MYRSSTLVMFTAQPVVYVLRNPGAKTIEEDVLKALLKAGYITEDIYIQPQLTQFQRAARTDKGVSALRQVLSLKLRKFNSCWHSFTNIILFRSVGVVIFHHESSQVVFFKLAKSRFL